MSRPPWIAVPEPRAPRGVHTIDIAMLLGRAADAGMGQPTDGVLQATALAVAFAEELGWSAEQVDCVRYASLLRWAGCSSHGHEFVALFDDEIGVHQEAIRMDFASFEPLRYILRHAGRGRGIQGRARTLIRSFTLGPGFTRQVFTASCEVASQLASLLLVPQDVADAVRTGFERWDGRGFPGERSGETIPPVARLVQVAWDWAVFERHLGPEVATQAVLARAGTSLDPVLAARAARTAPAAWQHLGSLAAEATWDDVVRRSSPDVPALSGSQVVTALGAVAAFADVKCPFTTGQSAEVARIAADAARQLGLDAAVALQAGLCQGLGRTALPGGVWEGGTPLPAATWERIRQYPYHTERLVGAVPALVVLAESASMVQERLDGTGYHRRLPALALPMTARVLQASLAAVAMGRDRPWRPAHGREARSDLLAAEVAAGRLDATAVDAVIAADAAAAGAPGTAPPREWGLSEREMEVLRLIATGASKRAVADRLVISVHTVDSHVRHIYEKLDVSTRAAAAVAAIRLGIV